MDSLVVGLVIVAMIGAAVNYIHKSKKQGVKCIGCPAAGTCASKNGQMSCSGSCQSSSR